VGIEAPISNPQPLFAMPGEDGNVLITGSATDLTVPTLLQGHSNSVNETVWSPGPGTGHVGLLASASDDGTVRLWRIGWQRENE
jgi:WD40 repeat protein